MWYSRVLIGAFAIIIIAGSSVLGWLACYTLWYAWQAARAGWPLRNWAWWDHLPKDRSRHR